MFTWLLFSTLLTLAYIAVMQVYLYGWRQTPEWKIPDGWIPETKVTVLIPARNEALHIQDSLASITSGNYPVHLLEIIVLDDFSNDETAQVATQFALSHAEKTQIRVVRLADFLPAEYAYQANKKRAIEYGVEQASGEIIVTTDADCIMGKFWLSTIISKLKYPGPSAPLLLTGPVLFHRERNLLQYFQSLDLLGLMGITAAGIRLGFQRMGNGANLAYYKWLFGAVNGYEGNRGTASGDDMFLIQKVAAQYPGRVAFLKNEAAAVRTESPADLRSFVQQRLRWGTKNAGLPEWPVRLVLLSVFLFCWSLFGNLVGACTGQTFWIQVFVIQVLAKAISDWMLLSTMCRYFGRSQLLQQFFPAFLLHTLYIPLIGAGSLFMKNYQWKGRSVGSTEKKNKGE